MTLLHQAAQKAVEAHYKELGDAWIAFDGSPGTAKRVNFALGMLGFAIDALVAQMSALQQQPEPVAWMHEFTDPHTGERTRQPRKNKPTEYEVLPGELVTPLYTAPPALQHQEEPREPVARPSMSMYASAADYSAAMDGWIATTRQCPACKGKFGVDGQACDLCNATGRVPSTTRQQEVGSGREQTLAGLLKRCARCLPPEHATRKLATEYLRENGYLSPLRAAAPSTPEKAGGVSDGVGGNDGR